MPNATRLRRSAGILVSAALLAGCAPSLGGATTAASTAPKDSAHSAASEPPAKATMICDDEILTRVAASLGLLAPPTTSTHWADHLYTCTYQLPMGKLVTSVKVAADDAAARSYLHSQRAKLTKPQDTGGFGDEAYETDDGVLIAAKDNLVLRVDATALPDTLGVAPIQETRIELARVVGSGIFNCWT